MSSIIIVILVTLGTLFVLLSAIGLVRMPDTYLRISVNTKAATLGVGLILVGTAVFFNDLSTTSRSLVIILFVFLTAPVSAHLIGRAAYFMGVKMWKGSLIDDLEGKYQKNTHVLKSDSGDGDSPDHSKDEDDIVK
ncbi:monovalent cation/H(+) antiporter subunit G [Salegentibacter sp. JZCK2]|uniref:monovalent cation/H(+) antiporter subunit G n=1 Tax=Salegentibacter tibetensis TaxID=2873600 RepID=UPI001CC8FC1D|nr:monovalent cation/H(+) antiporter subunit G [Salegentibacter tibetensis]MBZ9729832.1 monovalent cation/H(+) antiporter subunit G [Salegentibacter tibetensis]